jgi:hypothetical protein
VVPFGFGASGPVGDLQGCFKEYCIIVVEAILTTLLIPGILSGCLYPAVSLCRPVIPPARLCYESSLSTAQTAVSFTDLHSSVV